MRTCYFAEQEYKRLSKDFEHYKIHRSPSTGLYKEEVSSDDEQLLLLEFDAIAEIKTNNNRE